MRKKKKRKGFGYYFYAVVVLLLTIANITLAILLLTHVQETEVKGNNYSEKSDIIEWFDELLHKYQHLTGFSDIRINRLCIILNSQINKLKKLIEQ